MYMEGKRGQRLKVYLDKAACLSIRALRSSFSCWTFLRFSSNLTFFSVWSKKTTEWSRSHNACYPARIIICFNPHQFVYLHQLFLLLVELFVFDIQHHFEALQLLLQIQGVRVFLQGQRNTAKIDKTSKISSLWQQREWYVVNMPEPGNRRLSASLRKYSLLWTLKLWMFRWHTMT